MLNLKLSKMGNYLQLGQSKSMLIAIKDISKECGKDKFYSKNFLSKAYLMKLLAKIDRSYVQIK